MKSKLLTISKLDASRRQLETAVRLYFSEADPVSIHTLASASYNVLRGINKKNRSTPMIKDLLKNIIKPEHVKFLSKNFNKAENFFKHGNRDPGNVLRFAPFLTEVFLYESCCKYRELTSENIPIFR